MVRLTVQFEGEQTVAVAPIRTSGDDDHIAVLTVELQCVLLSDEETDSAEVVGDGPLDVGLGTVHPLGVHGTVGGDDVALLELVSVVRGTIGTEVVPSSEHLSAGCGESYIVCGEVLGTDLGHVWDVIIG